MYVCMSVRNGFTIEIYGFMHSLRTLWHVPLRMPSCDGMEIEVGGRRLAAQQKDERRQDNGDKKRLAHHHPSNLLHSLTREWIGGGQHGGRLASASSFTISNFPCAPHEAPDVHAYT